MKIHPSAIVHPAAQLDEGVEVGPFCAVGEHVRLGAGTRLVSHVVLDGWTTLGRNNVVYPGAVIGVAPQDLRYNGERSYVTIGDGNQIREYVTIHRASDAEGVTSIGSDNMIMGYCHVAHNCHLGSQIIMANYVGLAGHAIIEDQAVLGGMCGIHQFVRVGRLSMVGGLAKVIKDVPPFAIVDGQPARVYGLNIRGLQRRGVDKEARLALKRAFRLVTGSGLNLPQAVEAIRTTIPRNPDVDHLLKFLEAPSRMGVMNRREDAHTARTAPASREVAPPNGRAFEREPAGL